MHVQRFLGVSSQFGIRGFRLLALAALAACGTSAGTAESPGLDGGGDGSSVDAAGASGHTDGGGSHGDAGASGSGADAGDGGSSTSPHDGGGQSEDGSLADSGADAGNDDALADSGADAGNDGAVDAGPNAGDGGNEGNAASDGGADAGEGGDADAGAGAEDGGDGAASFDANGSDLDTGTSGDGGVLEAGSDEGGSGNPDGGSDALAPIPAKVDMLFDIDNSASMGDKQRYFAQAIPDLINRLLNPNCVDSSGNPVLDNQGNPLQSVNGICSQGQLEFTPVHDMHLGIVTSSLGSRLSDAPEAEQSSGFVICSPTATPLPPLDTISAHNDDQGHLIARSLTYGPDAATVTEGTVDAGVVPSYTPAPSGFLDWYPTTADNDGVPNPLPAGLEAITDGGTLQSDFAAIVQGAGIYGCGIESQLESWYRFLIQPDPYSSLTLNASNQAQWTGVDTVLLQERADFLRPDSLIAVVVLTDENDSEIDVRSINGQGYLFMGAGFDPPRGTSACAADPADASCTNCPVTGSTDPACVDAGSTYTAQNDWGFDPNLRHAHMKEKYGLDPQYPWQRYVIGLSQATVPDRAGEYPSGASEYVGTPDCTNPLFAAQLPSGAALDGTPAAATLCNLPAGTRTKDLVFYAIIGGVPNQLLHYTPNDPAASVLSQADWVRILGSGPASTGLSDPPSYDYTGIDPHMIESSKDRTTTTIVVDDSKTNALAAASLPTGSDPVNGREWTTDQPYDPASGTGYPYAPHVIPVDLEYACIFPLTTPRDCSSDAPQNAYECDCPATAGLTPDEVPSVCDPTNPTMQIAGKAYPTIRELQVARLLGNQGVVSSICPIDVVDNESGNDPNYGYRPAMAPIIDRLKGHLPGGVAGH